jgi:hypothetical protein
MTSSANALKSSPGGFPYSIALETSQKNKGIKDENLQDSGGGVGNTRILVE